MTSYTTRAEYVDFHRHWFASKPEIVQLLDSPRLGHALIRLCYRATPAPGTVQDAVSWLALTFALQDGTWRLCPIRAPSLSRHRERARTVRNRLTWIALKPPLFTEARLRLSVH